MTDCEVLPQSDVRCCFRVLLAVDRLQARATVYSVAREIGCSRSLVQTALKVAAQQLGLVFERAGAAYQIIDWGVLNKSAVIALMASAEKATANTISAPHPQDPHGSMEQALHQPNNEAEIIPVKGITRIDHELSSTKAWHVTLHRASGNLERTFSDGVYGGKEDAYRAALEWRDQKVSECPLMPRVARVSIIRKNNRTGVAGVFRWPADGSMVKDAHWGVQWVEVEGAKPVRRKFSIKRYGEQTAKLLAVAARENALASLVDSS